MLKVSLVPGMRCPTCGAVDELFTRWYGRLQCDDCGAKYNKKMASFIIADADTSRIVYAVMNVENIYIDERGYHHENIHVEFNTDTPLTEIFDYPQGR